VGTNSQYASKKRRAKMMFLSKAHNLLQFSRLPFQKWHEQKVSPPLLKQVKNGISFSLSSQERVGVRWFELDTEGIIQTNDRLL